MLSAALPDGAVRLQTWVLRAAVARGGTEPAQNPTWQPGGATLHFLELICGPELAFKLLQVRIAFAE